MPLTDEGPTFDAQTTINNTFFPKHLCTPGTVLLVWKPSANFLPSPKYDNLQLRGRRHYPVFKETPLANKFSGDSDVSKMRLPLVTWGIFLE